MESLRSEQQSAEQAVAAPEIHTLRLGAVFQSRNVLTDKQVEEVLRFQGETGLAFGDAAVKLGFVSDTDLKHALARQRGYPRIDPDSVSLTSNALVAARYPFCRQSDALRDIRTRLKDAWADSGQKSLAVVGAHERAGRSHLVANLGVSFAQLGIPTLVVDADLRRPAQHRLFGLSNRSGLEAVLCKRDGLQLHRMKEVPDLWVLPAGPAPLDPIQLLSTERFGGLIESLEKRFEVILFDTPPLLTYRDGEIVARRVKSAVFVVRKDRANADAESRCVQQFTQHGIRMVGAVLNAAA